MPRYDYACQRCGHTFEAQQKIADDPLKTCPSCHQDALERLVAKTSFALKGSGWYADGYGAQAKTDSTSDKKEKADKPEKTESKPAASPAESKPKPEPAKTAKDGGD